MLNGASAKFFDKLVGEAGDINEGRVLRRLEDDVRLGRVISVPVALPTMANGALQICTTLVTS